MSGTRYLFDRTAGIGIPYRVTGETVRQTDAVMAKTAIGLCIGDKCMRLSDGEDGLCTDHRKED